MGKLEQIKAEFSQLEWPEKVRLWDRICDEVEPHLELSDAAKKAIANHKADRTRLYPIKDLDK